MVEHRSTIYNLRLKNTTTAEKLAGVYYDMRRALITSNIVLIDNLMAKIS
jgi:hypothetical protein